MLSLFGGLMLVKATQAQIPSFGTRPQTQIRSLLQQYVCEALILRLCDQVNVMLKSIVRG